MLITLNKKKQKKKITIEVLIIFVIFLQLIIFIFFFFNDTATTEIYTLSLHDALPIRRWPSHAGVFHFRAPALPAQRCLGGGFGRGAKPPSEWNVQRVRLACGPRAPPRSWTLLIALD